MLGKVLDRTIAPDRRVYRLGDWPFLNALEPLLPVIAFPDLDPLFEPYRCVFQSNRSHY